METVRKGALRLTSLVCLVALAACSSGGGGGTSSVGTPANTTANNTNPNNTTSNNTTSNNTTSNNNTASNNTTPLVTITAPDNPNVGTTPYNGFDFSTKLPPIGTNFSLTGTIVKVTSTAVGGAGLDLATRASDTATFEGTFTSNGVTYPIFNLSVPSLGFTANNVRGDGTTATTSTGGTVNAAIATLNYTILGAWTYMPSGGGTSYLGQTATGYQTPDSGLPTSGTATYVGNSSTTGGAIGAYAVNTSSGAQAGTLGGNVSVTADFGANTVSGTMTNMSATPAGGSTSTPWNNVSLSGHIGNANPNTRNTIFGNTTAAAAPSGAGTAAFTTAATGNFGGTFNGPGAQELGATWTLYESTNGGKAAFGTIAATATTTP